MKKIVELPPGNDDIEVVREVHALCDNRNTKKGAGPYPVIVEEHLFAGAGAVRGFAQSSDGVEIHPSTCMVRSSAFLRSKDLASLGYRRLRQLHTNRGTSTTQAGEVQRRQTVAVGTTAKVTTTQGTQSPDSVSPRTCSQGRG